MDSLPGPLDSCSAAGGFGLPILEAVLPNSREYDTGEGIGEGLNDEAGRFVGIAVLPFDGVADAGIGNLSADAVVRAGFARSGAPARSPPFGGGLAPVTADYPQLRTA
jgi:hypothetical protein